MLIRCPYCGSDLDRPIQFGIKSCKNCTSLFETTPENELLAAAWELKKSKIGIEQLMHRTKLSLDKANFVHNYIIEQGYSHDDFFKLVKGKRI